MAPVAFFRMWIVNVLGFLLPECSKSNSKETQISNQYHLIQTTWPFVYIFLIYENILIGVFVLGKGVTDFFQMCYTDRGWYKSILKE